MKNLKWLVGLLALVTIFSLAHGQAQALKPQHSLDQLLSVSAEAFLEFYAKQTDLPTESFQAQYKVSVVIKNEQKKDIILGKIYAGFSLPNGNSLGMRAFFYDKKKPNEEREAILKPGENLKFDIATGVYTSRLLAESEGYPILFTIAFTRKEKPVAGPYSALLPPLLNLPVWKPGIKGKELDLRPLLEEPQKTESF